MPRLPRVVMSVFAACTYATATQYCSAQHGSATSSEAVALIRAGVAADETGLIQYLRGHTPLQLSPGGYDRLSKQLAAPESAGREKAVATLAKGGPGVAVRLRDQTATADTDLERRKAAILEAIDREWPPRDTALFRAAIRALARNTSEAAVGALLEILPVLAEDDLQAFVWRAADRVAARGNAVPLAVAARATDPDPSRRGLAAYLLGRRGTGDQQALARKLLSDPDATVRLRAAQGLLGAGETTDAVPALIPLVAVDPITVAWQADELLRWVSGPAGPANLLTPESNRAVAAAAWADWWAGHRAGLRWPDLCREPRRPSLLLVTLDLPVPRRTTLVGCDGRPRWTATSDGEYLVVNQLLPSGRAVGIAYLRETDPKAATSAAALADFTPGRGAGVRYELGTRLLERVSAELWLGGTRVVTGRDRVTAYPNGADRPGPNLRYTLDPALVRVGWDAAVPDGYHTRAEFDRYRLAEYDRDGRLVWEAPLSPATPVSLVHTLPLVRVGFDDLPGREDLNSAAARRLGELTCQDRARRYLAARAIRSDYGQPSLTAVTRLFAAVGVECLQPPLEALPAEDHLPVMSEAMRALAGATACRAETVLAGMADADEWVRIGAVRYASVSASKPFAAMTGDILDALIRATGDKSPHVRAQALEGLGRMPGAASRAVPVLVRALKDAVRPSGTYGASPAVVAAMTLGSMGSEAADAISPLIASCKSPDGALAAASCLALADIVKGSARMGEVGSVLRAVVRDDKRADVRAAGVTSLSRLGNIEGVLPDLLRALADPGSGEEVRTAILLAIGRSGAAASSAVPQTLQALSEATDVAEQLAAISALKASGDVARPHAGTIRAWAERQSNLQVQKAGRRLADGLERRP